MSLLQRLASKVCLMAVVCNFACAILIIIEWPGAELIGGVLNVVWTKAVEMNITYLFNRGVLYYIVGVSSPHFFPYNIKFVCVVRFFFIRSSRLATCPKTALATVCCQLYIIIVSSV